MSALVSLFLFIGLCGCSEARVSMQSSCGSLESCTLCVRRDGCGAWPSAHITYEHHSLPVIILLSSFLHQRQGTACGSLCMTVSEHAPCSLLGLVHLGRVRSTWDESQKVRDKATESQKTVILQLKRWIHRMVHIPWTVHARRYQTHMRRQAMPTVWIYCVYY